MRIPLSLQRTALAILIAALATIGGALVFEHGFGLRPCKLCLEQRYPYYLAIPIALAAVVLPARFTRIALVLLALVFLVGAGLGAYHAGVEWKWWAGPQDCAGPITDLGGAGGLLKKIETIRIVRCDEVQWRFLGLSLAGYNVLISLALAAVALWGALGAYRTIRELD